MNEPMEEIMFAGQIPVTIFKFRRDKHDFENGWENAYLKELIETLTPGMAVMDVGAENGEFTAMAGKIVGGDNLHIFEPSLDYWNNIRKLWIENRLANPKGCFCGYVGQKTDFDIYDANFGWPVTGDEEIFYDTHHSAPSVDKNKTISIDDYCKFTNNYPGVIMMDIEGAELDALLGMEEAIQKTSPTIFISIHSNDLIKQRSGGRKQDIFELLKEFDYVSQHINTDHEEHWKFYKNLKKINNVFPVKRVYRYI